MDMLSFSFGVRVRCKLVVLALMAGGLASAQCTAVLNPSSIHISSAKTTGTVAVSANTSNCARTTKSNADWISIAFGQTGNGTSGSFGYTINASTLNTSRTGTISVTTPTST